MTLAEKAKTEYSRNVGSSQQLRAKLAEVIPSLTPQTWSLLGKRSQYCSTAFSGQGLSEAASAIDASTMLLLYQELNLSPATTPNALGPPLSHQLPVKIRHRDLIGKT